MEQLEQCLEHGRCYITIKILKQTNKRVNLSASIPASPLDYGAGFTVDHKCC